MIYTLKINTTDSRKLKEQIETYCSKNNIDIPKEHYEKLAYYIHDKSYMYVDEVKADSEESAFDKFDESRIIEQVEITDINDSDEYEAEQRALAHYEAMQEDKAMEEYYERKYGND